MSRSKETCSFGGLADIEALVAERVEIGWAGEPGGDPAETTPVAARPSGNAVVPVGAGGYLLVRRLASGGMADVYLARRRGLAGIDQEVVVKRLRREVLGSRIIVRMFLWEAWISSRLSHPNIVRFHDLCLAGERYHLVLEHVRGADLAAIARHARVAGEPLPIEAAIEVGVGATRALDHAHRLADAEGRPVGLVHRDISPHNLLVSEAGDIKVTDFGVAKTTSAFVPRETVVGLVKGKMAYVAPEQLLDGPVDARGDLFALGVVLFELIANRRLFLRDSELETFRAVRAAEIPPLRALRAECPYALERLVRRALAKNPAERFESAGAMLAALEQVGGRNANVRGRRALGAAASAVASRARGATPREPPPAAWPALARPLRFCPVAPMVEEAARSSQATPADPEPHTAPEGACARARADSAPPPDRPFPLVRSARRAVDAAHEGAERLAHAPSTRPRWSVGLGRGLDAADGSRGARTLGRSGRRAASLVMAFVAGALATAGTQALERGLGGSRNAPAHAAAGDCRAGAPACEGADAGASR